MRLICVSDTHCDPLLPRVPQWILKNCNPDNTVILVCGDTTNNGFQHEYEFIHNAFAPIVNRFAIIWVPGNHDYGAAGNTYQEAAMRRWRAFTHVSDYPTLFEMDGLRIIGLDSCVGNVDTEILHFASGEIGPEQLEKLGKILHQPFDGFSILGLHHHIVDLGIKDHFMELDDAQKLRDVIRGRVDMVINGHRHIEKYRPDYDGIRILGCPSTPACKWMWEVDIQEAISIKIVEV